MTAVKFGRLWDGERVVTNAVVIVEGDRIVRVGDAATMPSGATVIDLSRFTGLPGLIDAHTHITYYWDRAPGTRPRGQRRLPAVSVLLAQDNARKTLETGVTTVRDLNAGNDMDFAMRELVARGAMIGPRIFASGQGLSARQGATPDPAAMQKRVEDRVKAGADWIKVFGSRGGFENVDGTQTVSFDEMKVIVETAHALGKPVAIHSYGPSGVRDAVGAGADSVEHGADLDDETIAEMVKRGTVWVPTVDHNRYYIEARDEYGFAPGSEVALKDYIDRNVESLRRAVKAGVRIAMGSDALWADGSLMLGSVKPFEFSRSTYERRYRDPRFRELFDWNYDKVLDEYRAGAEDIKAWLGDGPILTDDKPVIEYFLSLPKGEPPPDLTSLRPRPAEIARP